MADSETAEESLRDSSCEHFDKTQVLRGSLRLQSGKCPLGGEEQRQRPLGRLLQVVQGAMMECVPVLFLG